MLNIAAVRRPDGSVTHYVATFSEITVLKQQQYRLERMAHFDPLTKLPNRVLLADRMEQTMAHVRRHGHLLAICYLDLDGFKPVNDQYGHEAGDQLLVNLAHRLFGHMRENDTVARIGGDEFVLLLSDLKSVEECAQTLVRMLTLIGAPYTVKGGHMVSITASIGVTLYPNDSSDADTLLRHADWAMYQAKQAGRNRYYLFDPKHDPK